MAATPARAGQRLKRPGTLAAALLVCVLLLQGRSGRNAQCDCPDDQQRQLPAGAPGIEHGVGSSTNLPDGSSSGASSDGGSLTVERMMELLQQPVGLYGPQQKGGMPANWPFLMAHMTDMLAVHPLKTKGLPLVMDAHVYRWFGKAYNFNKSAGHINSAYQSPIPSCHFFVDHKYKLLYIRNSKTAGTSLCLALGQKDWPMWCTIYPDKCYSKCQGRPLCLELVTDNRMLKKVFNEYTVFSFVRNPYTRAISSWNHINKIGVQPHCHDSFEKFAELPSFYGAKCLTNGTCCKEKFGWHLHHAEDQSSCLFDVRGRPSVDFFGRVESVDEDLQELFSIVNSRLGAGVKPLSVGRLPHYRLAREELQHNITEQWRWYAELYLNSSTALKDVYSYYHKDFERLHVPEIVRDP